MRDEDPFEWNDWRQQDERERRRNRYFEAPEVPDNAFLLSLQKSETRCIFLAGSITGAWNWQEKAAKVLLPHFHVFNPRRENYVWSESEERTQIQWEYVHLKFCDCIYFYFSNETLAPITLFEYGKVLGGNLSYPEKQLFVCIHPEYKRKNDVLIQTELVLGRKFVESNIFLDFDASLDYVVKNA